MIMLCLSDNTTKKRARQTIRFTVGKASRMEHTRSHKSTLRIHPSKFATSWKLARNNNYRPSGYRADKRWPTKRYFAMLPDGSWKSSVDRGTGNKRENERERERRTERREKERERRRDIVLAGRTSQRVGASVVGAYGPSLLCLVK